MRPFGALCACFVARRLHRGQLRVVLAAEALHIQLLLQRRVLELHFEEGVVFLKNCVPLNHFQFFLKIFPLFFRMVQKTVNIHPGRHHQGAIHVPHTPRLNFLYGIFVFDVFKALLLRCNFKNERRPEMREVLVEEGMVFSLGQFILVR